MKEQEIIKPDLFEVSTTAYDSAKIVALYTLDKEGITPNKKNLKKKTTELLRIKYENMKLNPQLDFELISITLKCSDTKKEIGYCLLSSFDTYDALAYLFVRKEYRGFGHSKKLIQYFEQQSDKVKLIEFNEETSLENRKIFKDFGYDYLHNLRYNDAIALIKKCEIDEIEKAFELQIFKEVLVGVI